MSPLQIAAYFGETEKVTALLTDGAAVNEVNEFGRTALHYASNHPEVEQLLVEAGAVWNIPDGFGTTAGETVDRNGNSNDGRYNSMRLHADLVKSLPEVPGNFQVLPSIRI
jgi:ankyrin repeat protein